MEGVERRKNCKFREKIMVNKQADILFKNRWDKMDVCCEFLFLNGGFRNYLRVVGE